MRKTADENRRRSCIASLETYTNIYTIISIFDAILTIKDVWKSDDKAALALIVALSFWSDLLKRKRCQKIEKCMNDIMSEDPIFFSHFSVTIYSILTHMLYILLHSSQSFLKCVTSLYQSQTHNNDSFLFLHLLGLDSHRQCHCGKAARSANTLNNWIRSGQTRLVIKKRQAA